MFAYHTLYQIVYPFVWDCHFRDVLVFIKSVFTAFCLSFQHCWNPFLFFCLFFSRLISPIASKQMNLSQFLFVWSQSSFIFIKCQHCFSVLAKNLASVLCFWRHLLVSHISKKKVHCKWLLRINPYLLITKDIVIFYFFIFFHSNRCVVLTSLCFPQHYSFASLSVKEQLN